MISIRRYAIYVSIAACILLFTYYRDPIALKSRLIDGYETDPKDSRFRWDRVPVRYPVRGKVSLPSGSPKKLPKVQYDFPPETGQQGTKRKERQNAVRQTFQSCWAAYKKHAWMKDELAPLSGSSKDGFGGWAATLVDNLDTLWIMGLKDEFEEAVQAAITIDLTYSTTEEINVFETTIRHLGGFLAAYDLSGDERLLEKAKEFGSMLIVAFDTPNHLPITRWNAFGNLRGPQAADNTVLLAEIGSLTMEFTRLSMLTGDSKWYDAVIRIVRLFEKQQFKTSLPGMWPVTVNAFDADFASDTFFTLSAMSDSTYEYFPKMHALLGGVDTVYKKLYENSMATAIKYLLWRPITPENADILLSGSVRKSGEMTAARLDPQGQHLVCFAGGMFALGGKLFNNPAHVDIGKKLTEGCVYTYKAMPMGIMPEVFRMYPCADRLDCKWNETAWKDAVREENSLNDDPDELIKRKRLPPGFIQIGDRRYILRPEAIESVFILYRITGESHFQESAWDMFTAIRNVTQTSLGANAAVRDVSYSIDEIGDVGTLQTDSMESFWMAETLKYFYLAFTEPDVIDLDEWVFNTEAHPFKRALPRDR